MERRYQRGRFGCKVENSSKEKPVITLYEYIANFERMVRKAKEEVGKARN